jgi:hypothetical protein
MNTQAPHPAKTKTMPSISKKTWIGDLYCSKAIPMASIKTKTTETRMMIAGMILGKSGKQDNTSAYGPDGDHATVIIRIATDASDTSHSFNAMD